MQNSRSPAQTHRNATRNTAELGAPDGWDDNPSAWKRRVPAALLALAGLGIATWLALFQLGIVSSVWDPLFGNGSRIILTSGVSRMLPVPDAALGAAGYLADVVFCLVGGTLRWKHQPWAVLLLALTVFPMATGSLLLLILQPTLYHTWCSPCLVSVAISLSLVPHAWSELTASWQRVRSRLELGIGFWAAWWGG